MNNHNQKGIASFLAIIIVIVVGVLAIGGVLAYQYWRAPEKGVEVETPKTEAPEVEAPKDETADWRTYTDNEFGFSFYYPKSWKLNTEGGVITLTNFGPYYDDRIIITKQVGNQVKNTDAKFGDVIYYYDGINKSWMVNKNTNLESGIKKAIPSFYTISNFPVFIGIGRWKTNIVPLSTNKFLIVHITGSGFTGVLDPFTATISEINANISPEVIDNLINLIKTQTNK